MKEDMLIVIDRLPELTVRAIGFDHEAKAGGNNKYGRYTLRPVLEFRVDGYLGWWVYYRDTRQIVLNITDSNYQSHTTYSTQEEIVSYLEREDAFDKEHRKLPNFIYPKGYRSWVKRFKLKKILEVCGRK